MPESYLARQVAEMESDMKELKLAVRELQDWKLKIVAYGTAIGLVIGILTGDGVVSLKHFLGH